MRSRSSAHRSLGLFPWLLLLACSHRGTVPTAAVAAAPAEAAAGACEEAIADVVFGTEPAATLLRAPMPPDVRMGMRVGARPPEQPVYSVAIHEVHSDHLATLAWFDVDPKTGAMIESGAGDRPLLVPPALGHRVVAACR